MARNKQFTNSAIIRFVWTKDMNELIESLAKKNDLNKSEYIRKILRKNMDMVL
jgi:hypothetical protein